MHTAADLSNTYCSVPHAVIGNIVRCAILQYMCVKKASRECARFIGARV